MWVGLIIGVIVLGAVLLAVVGVVAYFLVGRREDQAQAQRVTQALPGGSAKIIEIGNHSANQEKDSISYALRLEITPPSGDVYQTISLWIVEYDRRSEIQVGSVIPVKIDRAKPKVVYPEPKWALQPVDFEYGEEDMTN